MVSSRVGALWNGSLKVAIKCAVTYLEDDTPSRPLNAPRSTLCAQQGIGVVAVVAVVVLTELDVLYGHGRRCVGK